MHKAILAIVLLVQAPHLFSQSLKDLTFGEDNTFEVATWNLEWFPKNNQITIDSVALIIQSLKIDVMAIQEIDDGLSFNTLKNSLPGCS